MSDRLYIFKDTISKILINYMREESNFISPSQVIKMNYIRKGQIKIICHLIKYNVKNRILYAVFFTSMHNPNLLWHLKNIIRRLQNNSPEIFKSIKIMKVECCMF